MLKVAMNIGGGNGVYNNIPMFYEFESAKDFTDFIRDQMFNIILWSHDNYGLKSNLWLGVHIQEDVEDDDYFFWDFVISCKNIREFEQYAKMSREDIDALRSSKQRDEKLKDILNEQTTNL